ncbi:MAG: DUF5320 domain-containing protein [Anaerolineales bacterium]|jgi:hypothetical protein
MPRGDRTGPRGYGAMTGRAGGYCAGYGAPGFANPAAGYGMRFGGRGGGHGWRHWYYASGQPGWARAGYGSLPAEQELARLKEESEWLSDRLESIDRRIQELEKEQDS